MDMRSIFAFLGPPGIVLAFMPLLFPAAGCYYDNLEKIHPELLLDAGCDTAGVISYQSQIAPLLAVSCGANDNSCHNAFSAGGGYVFDHYAGVKAAAQGDKFLSSITWDGNAIQMPKGNAARLSDCRIAEIEKWIGAGSPDN